MWLSGHGGEGGGDGLEVGFDVGGGGGADAVGVAGVGAGDAVAEVAFDPGEGGVAELVVDPGWVPTRMGGPGASDGLCLGTSCRSGWHE